MDVCRFPFPTGEGRVEAQGYRHAAISLTRPLIGPTMKVGVNRLPFSEAFDYRNRPVLVPVKPKECLCHRNREEPVLSVCFLGEVFCFVFQLVISLEVFCAKCFCE